MMLILSSSCSRFFLAAFLSLSLVVILASGHWGSPDRLDLIVSEQGSELALFKTSDSSADDLEHQFIPSSAPFNFSAKAFINIRQEFLLLYSNLSIYPARAPPFLPV